MTEQQRADHNAETDALWEAYARGENTRVPIVFASDEALWLRLTGHTFRQFYTDPRVHLEVLLAGAWWTAEHVVHDQHVGPPTESWSVTPRFWMFEPEYFGCEIMLQDHSFAWTRPLAGSKWDVLKAIADVDPNDAVRRGHLWRLFQGLKELAEKITYRGLPVRVISPGAGTHGLFTVACHLRGPEQLCFDLLDDPEYAHQLLGVLAEKTLERIRTWRELDGSGGELPLPDGWGMADDSLQLLSEEAYRQYVLPHHKRLYSAMTTGHRRMHLCGYAQQHFSTLYHELGIRALDGPGPFVDHGALLQELPDLTLQAQCDHTILLMGPVPAVESMMRAMLTPQACQPGRFQILGYIGPHTPLEHVAAMYQVGRQYGVIRP